MPRRVLKAAAMLTEKERVEREAVLTALGEEAKAASYQAPENLRGRVRRTPNQIATQWEEMR